MGLLLGISYIAVMGVASNLIGAALPRRWFDPRRFPFKPWAFEQQGRFYDKLRIRKWKDKLPDMSKYLRFLPRKALTDGSSQRVELLVQETCVAELVHAALMVLALPVLLCRQWWAALMVAVYDLVGNLPFIMIQRYNRPRLERLAEKLARREEALVHE